MITSPVPRKSLIVGLLPWPLNLILNVTLIDFRLRELDSEPKSWVQKIDCLNGWWHGEEKARGRKVVGSNLCVRISMAAKFFIR